MLWECALEGDSEPFWPLFLVTAVELQMYPSDIFLHPCVVLFFGSLSLGLFFIRVPVSELRVHLYPVLFHPSILFVNILRSHPWSLRVASAVYLCEEHH